VKSPFSQTMLTHRSARIEASTVTIATAPNEAAS
jgi:hypothetical protein